MNKIELILCHEDGTWTTEVVSIPDNIDREDLNAVQLWSITLYSNDKYSDVVHIGVHNTDPEDDECSSDWPEDDN